jgi:hypothetical protein
LRTGDLVMRDTEDRIHYLDRLKEMIKVKGLQVAATEVEDTLLGCPGGLVRDACVAGVDNGRGDGSLFPRAWVVLSAEGKRLGEEEVVRKLNAYVAERLSRHKHLAGGIEVVDSVSGISSGGGCVLTVSRFRGRHRGRCCGGRCGIDTMRGSRQSRRRVSCELCSSGHRLVGWDWQHDKVGRCMYTLELEGQHL